MFTVYTVCDVYSVCVCVCAHCVHNTFLRELVVLIRLVSLTLWYLTVLVVACQGITHWLLFMVHLTGTPYSGCLTL